MLVFSFIVSLINVITIVLLFIYVMVYVLFVSVFSFGVFFLFVFSIFDLFRCISFLLHSFLVVIFISPRPHSIPLLIFPLFLLCGVLLWIGFHGVLVDVASMLCVFIVSA